MKSVYNFVVAPKGDRYNNKKTKEVKYDLSKATVDGKTKEEIIEENKGHTVTPSFIKPGVDGDIKNYQPKKPK